MNSINKNIIVKLNMVNKYCTKILNNNNLVIFLIFFLAFFLRVHKVDKVPPALYWDEAAMALDAKSISLTGRDQHGNLWFQPLYPSWGDYKLPVYIISAVPFFKIIKNNPELAVRLPSVLAGTLTVLVVYFLAKELFKKNNPHYLPIIAMLLLAISPWHLQFSRAAFEGNLALLFNSLAVLFFIKAVKSKWRLALVFLFSVLGIYTYYSARIVLPIILISAFLIFYKKSLKNILSLFVVFILIFLAFLPLKFSPLASKAEQFRLSTTNILNDEKIIKYSSMLLDQDEDSFIARKVHHRFLYQAKQLMSHYFDHFSLNFLILTGDNNLRHSTTRVGVMFVVVFIGLVYGEYLLFKDNKKLFLFLNLSLSAAFLPACVPYEVPHSLRSLNAVVFLNIISAFGLVQLKKRKIILFSVFCFLFSEFLLYFHDYYKHYPSRSYFFWQAGYKEAVEEVYNNYQLADNIIFTDFYSRPYIYFLLYSDYPISEFQEQRQEFLIDNPLDYHETFKIGKIEFRNPNEGDFKSAKTMIITNPKQLINKSASTINPAFDVWKNF